LSVSEKDGVRAASIDGFCGNYVHTPQPQFPKVRFLQGEAAEEVLPLYQNG
jgi:hypothetical protein